MSISIVSPCIDSKLFASTGILLSATQCLCVVFFVTLLAGAASATHSKKFACHDCLYYRYGGSSSVTGANECISSRKGKQLAMGNCSYPQACRLKYYQDSTGEVIQVERRCIPNIDYNTPNRTVLDNVKVAVYCNTTGCNNNWRGLSKMNSDGPLQCYTGYAPFIDGFPLEPCKKKPFSNLNPECMLAQLSRQIIKNGIRYESTVFFARCTERLATLYGSNYPMFEYENQCYKEGCNGGDARSEIARASSSATTNVKASWLTSCALLTFLSFSVLLTRL